MLFTQIGIVVGELGAEAAADAAYFNAVEDYILSIAKVHISQATRQGSDLSSVSNEDLTEEERQEIYNSLLNQNSNKSPNEPSETDEYTQGLIDSIKGLGGDPTMQVKDTYTDGMMKAIEAL